MPITRVNGVDLHYHLQGEGTAVVFLHPPCIGSRVFTYLRNDLSQDHRTLMFDFRGHGRSASSDSRITIPLLVEDTCRLMDALDISTAYLCAYSVASMVALEAMLTHPNRFLGAALLGGLAEAKGWTKARLRIAGLTGRMRARDMLAAPILWVNSDNTQTFRRLRAETLAGDTAKWAEYLDSTAQYSAVARLPEIRQPVLLICGQKDKEFKGYAKILQKGLPNDSSAFIPGIKHTLPTYGADPIAPLIRGWLYAQEGRDQGEKEKISFVDSGFLPEHGNTAAVEDWAQH